MTTVKTSVASKSEPLARKIQYLATRTLAVGASLWSSSSPFSSPIHPQHKQAQSCCGFHSLLLSQNPLTCVSAFHLEAPLGIPRGGWHSREHVNRHGQHRQWNWRVNKKTPRWYQSTLDRLSTTVATAGEDIGSIASSSDPKPSTISSDVVESTRHLPRLFVEPRFPFSMAEMLDLDSSPDDTLTSNGNVPLQRSSLVSLNADQEHYLLDVMRITNSKRWGKGKASSTSDGSITDYTGCVRIFNGIDGEWLARVVEDPGSGNSKKKQRRKRGGNSKSSSGTVVECLEQLRLQEGENQKPKVKIQLLFGYIRDKQRRKWIFEKATELGIDSIRILETDFSNNSSGDTYKKKDLRWEDDRDKHLLHVIEAAEQCERLSIPKIGVEPYSIEDLSKEILASIGSSSDNTNKKQSESQEVEQNFWLVCRERSESSLPILSILDEVYQSPNPTIRILIGPEGGWSAHELETFSSLGPAVRFISLGPSVLRAETAAITAVASVAMYRDIVSGS